MPKSKPDAAAIMQAIAAACDDALNGKGPKRTGFAIFVFPFDAPEGARTNYVSNVSREDMIVAMREVLARFEGRAHSAPEARQ